MSAWKCGLRDAGMRLLAIVTSYKIAILAAACWLVSTGALEGLYWFLLALLTISARAFLDYIGVTRSGGGSSREQ